MLKVLQSNQIKEYLNLRLPFWGPAYFHPHSSLKNNGKLFCFKKRHQIKKNYHLLMICRSLQVKEQFVVNEAVTPQKKYCHMHDAVPISQFLLCAHFPHRKCIVISDKLKHYIIAIKSRPKGN
jgi:hypothetical protein